LSPIKRNQLLIAALLATIGFAASAQPAPGAGPGAMPGHPMMERGPHGRMDPARMQEHFAKRQGELKQKLQITPAQEGAWNTWTAAMKPGNFQRPDRGEIEKLTTPERIDRMRAMRTSHIAEMDKRGEATKVFYAALSPEQKKVFDSETARFGHRGGRGHHHKG
jgi:Spy/CpxP family protein refolding chaperone